MHADDIRENPRFLSFGDAWSARLLSALVKNQGSRGSLSVCFNRNLCIHNFVEEVGFTFRVNLRRPLAGELSKQLIVFACGQRQDVSEQAASEIGILESSADIPGQLIRGKKIIELFYRISGIWILWSRSQKLCLR